MKVLAGDIGGTYTRLALVELAAQTRILAEETTPSREVSSLPAHAEAFLRQAGERPGRACFGIAGPVVNGEVSTTNLPWHLSERALGDALRIPGLRLINDFVAVAHGVIQLGPTDWLELQTGTLDSRGAVAVIGAGTGLGEGFLVRSSAGYSVQSSEGGHATFAAESEREWALFKYLRERYGHVSWERVLSGPGLVDIFEFLSAGHTSAALDAVRQEMAGESAGEVITRHALAESDSLAAEALQLFATAYGAQAGNLALTVMATGGVYLAGGIARKIAPALAKGGFIAAFRRKGRLTALLERIPVRVILDADVGLLGAAVVAGSAANS